MPKSSITNFPLRSKMFDADGNLTYDWIKFFQRVSTYKPVIGTLSGIPTNLGEGDAGKIFIATDYHHIYEWDGVGWNWGPGDDGLAGSVHGWLISPPAWWVPCAGQVATYALSDGTTDTIALPDLTSGAPQAAYVKWGPSVSGPNAAIPPTVDLPASTSGPSSTEEVQSGTGATVASSGHSHDISSLTINDDGQPRHFQLLPYFRT